MRRMTQTFSVAGMTCQNCVRHAALDEAGYELAE